MAYCWCPNEHALLVNDTFMIVRQVLRLIVYYLMPFICISIFYSVIAKTLFDTQNVIYSPNSSTRSNPADADVDSNRLHVNKTSRVYHAQHSTRKLKQDQQAKKQFQTRQKVAKTVLFLCLVFFICWLPKQLHDLYW